jgi:hypothetical protein
MAFKKNRMNFAYFFLIPTWKKIPGKAGLKNEMLITNQEIDIS